VIDGNSGNNPTSHGNERPQPTFVEKSIQGRFPASPETKLSKLETRHLDETPKGSAHKRRRAQGIRRISVESIRCRLITLCHNPAFFSHRLIHGNKLYTLRHFLQIFFVLPPVLCARGVFLRFGPRPPAYRLSSQS
jgi:hypothetical protein